MTMELAELIWTEKYRPKILKEVVGQKHIVPRLQAFVNKKSLPHCLFAGPAGVGKTTCALAIAQELFGNHWHSNFLELNASDERGIDTIRVKVKDFARTVPLNGLFKIVYLDEADSLTKDAQHALRRTMENYAHVCRFILACNYSSRIIHPIQSRTAIFRFSTLDKDEINEFLRKVAKKEILNIDNEVYDMIIYNAEGDMRKALNLIQTAAITNTKITKDILYSITKHADPEDVKNMMTYALGGNFKKARHMLISLLYDRGIAPEDLIKEIASQIFSLDIHDNKKLFLMDKIGEYEFRLTEGSNAQIQLEALIAQMGLIGAQ